MLTRLRKFVLPAILLATACSQYDDSTINDRIDKLEDRVTALEKWQKEINSQIQTLQTTVNALNQQDKIIGVTPLENESGWEIAFSKSGTITILNGKDGKNGEDGQNGSNGTDGTTPTIGVKMEDDGNYYWTVNGEFLLDDTGKKISATAHISTPMIQINPETNKFEISYNNGLTWQVIGDAGSSFGIFTNIVDLGDSVVFNLADGSSISIPKKQSLAIVLDATSYGVSAGAPLLIPFKLEGTDDKTVVDGFATNGFEVEINITDTNNGQIMVMPPMPLVAGKLFLIAFNEKETAAKVLSFEEGKLIVENKTIPVPAKGGDFSFKVSTNLNYSVQVDYDALTWVSYVETKAMRSEEVFLSVSENTSEETRSGTINIIDDGGIPLESISVVQAGKSSSPATGGGKDDFNTMYSGTATYGNYTSTSGWDLKNGPLFSSDDWDVLTEWVPAIGGRTGAVGVLTSPLLEGGCGTLKFDYGSPAVISKGISFKLEIKNEEGTVVKEIPVTNADATQRQVLNFNETINVIGKFRLVFTNLCPAKKRVGNYDATCIFNLEWTGYAE